VPQTTPCPELRILTADLTDWARLCPARTAAACRCQTYEGGFGGDPGHEAHGGYVFCAFAALVILGQASQGQADLEALEVCVCVRACVCVPLKAASERYRAVRCRTQAWLCNRQMPVEGGFQGRTNKLVDGCYSFWQVGGPCTCRHAGRQAGSHPT
jgi:protein farnesyltransferase subunit beta